MYPKGTVMGGCAIFQSFRPKKNYGEIIQKKLPWTELSEGEKNVFLNMKYRKMCSRDWKKMWMTYLSSKPLYLR